MTLSEALAQRIREYLAQHKLSQREFARRLKISQGQVSYILSAKRRQGDFDFHARVAEQLGVPLSALIAELEGRVAAGRPVSSAAERGRSAGEASHEAEARIFLSYARAFDPREVEQAAQTARKIADLLWVHYRNQLAHPSRHRPEDPSGTPPAPGDTDPPAAADPATPRARPSRR